MRATLSEPELRVRNLVLLQQLGLFIDCLFKVVVCVEQRSERESPRKLDAGDLQPVRIEKFN